MHNTITHGCGGINRTREQIQLMSYFNLKLLTTSTRSMPHIKKLKISMGHLHRFFIIYWEPSPLNVPNLKLRARREHMVLILKESAISFHCMKCGGWGCDCAITRYGI